MLNGRLRFGRHISRDLIQNLFVCAQSLTQHFCERRAIGFWRGGNQVGSSLDFGAVTVERAGGQVRSPQVGER